MSDMLPLDRASAMVPPAALPDAVPEAGPEAERDREAGAADLRRRLMGEPPADPEAPGREAVVPNVLDILRSLLTVIVGAVFVMTFIAQPFRIPSESMERTLLVGDFLLVNKMIYAPPGAWKWLLPYREPRRGDVIVFHYPVKPEEHVVKRVIGTPGDAVHLQDGLATVNGVPQDEPYVAFEPAYPDAYRDNFPTQIYTDPGVDPGWWQEMRSDVHAGELVVPENEYFVLGDNRNFSRDSRYWGFVPRRNIVGRPFMIYFSLRERSATDPTQDDRLGQNTDLLERLKHFARWDRIGRIVR